MAQLGEALPAAAPTTTSLIGYVMVYQRAGRLEATPPAPDDPWIVELVYHHRAGDTLPMPSRWSDAVASATVTGATEAEVLDRLDRIVRHVGDATQVDGTEAHPRPAG